MIVHAPWLLLVVIALAVGFWLGRRSVGLPSEPAPAQPARESAPPAKASPGGDRRAAPSLPTSRAGGGRPALGAARSWGYQLQDIDVGRAAASRADVLVLDYARDGTDDTALTPGDIERLKRKPDGSRRLLLAYCSIGEAESYRFYWQKQWKRQKPGWLLGENPDWEENYSVRFWDPGWQRIIFGGTASYVDRIVAQGFDGVYLDKCDVFEDIREHFGKVARERADLEEDMVDFVAGVATHVRGLRSDFLVVMQNAEPLLEFPALRRVIDGVAKEELLFGLDRPEKANARDDVDWSRERLDLVKADGKPVFVVEYLDTPARILDAQRRIADLGYILYVAPKDRELDRLRENIAEA
ncbi:MAG: endo alpha-1,4 polygalactosaminidase [Hyphomicrobiaceae bacterium]